jgi:hypothetical protein
MLGRQAGRRGDLGGRGGRLRLQLLLGRLQLRLASRAGRGRALRLRRQGARPAGRAGSRAHGDGPRRERQPGARSQRARHAPVQARAAQGEAASARPLARLQTSLGFLLVSPNLGSPRGPTECRRWE